MTDNKNSLTPIFDELNAQYRTFPDLLTPVTDDHEDAKRDLATTALEVSQPKKIPLLSLKGWSPQAREIIVAINDARLDGQRTVNGESFANFANGRIQNGYVETHDISRLKQVISSL